MKELALKKRPSLSLVSAPEPEPDEEDFALSPFVVKQCFNGWLSEEVPVAVVHNFLPLTTQEFIQVELATVREGQTHRLWPSEVIEKFRVADVVRRQGQ